MLSMNEICTSHFGLIADYIMQRLHHLFQKLNTFFNLLLAIVATASALNDHHCGQPGRKHNVVIRDNRVVSLSKWNPRLDPSSAPASSWPWAVRLIAIPNGNVYLQCRGTIIDQEWLITNEHCFHGISVFRIFFDDAAGLGPDTSCALDARTHVVKHQYIDVALVNFASCLPPRTNRSPVQLRTACLPNLNYHFHDHMVLLGCTPDGARVVDESQATHLQQSLVKLVQHDFDELRGRTEYVIVKPADGKNATCWGASGSGLFDWLNRRWTLTAMHKASHSSSFMKMAVNISNVIPWIVQTTSQ